VRFEVILLVTVITEMGTTYRKNIILKAVTRCRLHGNGTVFHSVARVTVNGDISPVLWSIDAVRVIRELCCGRSMDNGDRGNG
jgi:hypothetical protein